jgi:hypothetical protein
MLHCSCKANRCADPNCERVTESGASSGIGEEEQRDTTAVHSRLFTMQKHTTHRQEIRQLQRTLPPRHRDSRPTQVFSSAGSQRRGGWLATSTAVRRVVLPAPSCVCVLVSLLRLQSCRREGHCAFCAPGWELRLTERLSPIAFGGATAQAARQRRREKLNKHTRVTKRTGTTGADNKARLLGCPAPRGTHRSRRRGLDDGIGGAAGTRAAA